MKVYIPMNYCSSKEFDVLIRKLLQVGWSYKHGKKHGKLLPPHGYPTLTVPTSPSDCRAFMNFRRDVRHALMVQERQQ